LLPEGQVTVPHLPVLKFAAEYVPEAAMMWKTGALNLSQTMIE
jgi:hypothetical protein